MKKEIVVKRGGEGAPLFRLLRFISKAVGKSGGEGDRAWMKHICIHEGLIFATDGRRIYYTENTFKLAKGYYTPTIELNVITLTPNGEIKKHAKGIKRIINDGYGEMQQIYTYDSLSCFLYPVYKAGVVIAVEFLEPLRRYSIDWNFAVHELHAESSAVKFISGDHTCGAIIMPIKL